MDRSNQNDIKAAIIDMDGVLWRADQPLGNLKKNFDRLETLGWSVTLATNNSTHSIEQYLSKLMEFGVKLDRKQIITSSQAAASYLSHKYPDGGKVYVLGEDSLERALNEEGFRHSDEEVIAVVAALDRNLTYQKLSQATILIRNGAEFIATNADRTFPMPYGLVPGAGAILVALQAATDKDPVIVGKPSPFMYQVALERMGSDPSQTLVIGDRLETDIAGAQELKCWTALVLSGVTTAEKAQRWKPTPHWIAPDLTHLLRDFLDHRQLRKTS